ncbi:MAG: pantoate--beta-alanine ligase [Planctomycetes bacterium]|nr:pantoate--beta-alanine ligase [Planctomycetota bacterium]
METVYVAVGSNVGDREAHLARAIDALRATPGVEVARVSSWRETEFVGEGPEQAAFLNGAVELRTALPPHALLAVLRALEQAAGRAFPHPQNHPRELDLDVIFFGERRIDTRELVVPHPRWHERSFVTEPLAELGVDLASRPRAQGTALLETVPALTERTAEWLQGGCVIGLVPTMGSLHEGHQSLMRAARRECDRVLATVFVNPLQFGPGEDLDAYPRDLTRDLELCREAGVDALFAPPVAQMYDEHFCSHVAVGREAEGMEGDVRAGHFVGVATVVARLFALSRPHRAYFGEKDAQQVAVVRRMCRDLGFPLQVVACPIVREPDGLARSSRNVYLGAADRKAAAVLHRALRSAREQFRRGLRDRDALLERTRAVLATEPRCHVDYVELRREGDLVELPAGPVDGGRLLVAARFVDGARPVRLLDNLSLDGEDDA